MKRTITGRPAARTMTLGELRQFLASIESVSDEAAVRTRVTLFGRHVRSVTVDEDDPGFLDYVRAVGDGSDDDRALDGHPGAGRRDPGDTGGDGRRTTTGASGKGDKGARGTSSRSKEPEATRA